MCIDISWGCIFILDGGKGSGFEWDTFNCATAVAEAISYYFVGQSLGWAELALQFVSFGEEEGEAARQ